MAAEMLSSNGGGHAPFVVGIGGTTRAGSSTEAALTLGLREVERLGGTTRLFGGEFIAKLPIYDPSVKELTAEQQELVDTFRKADGIMISSPGYHGSISGLVKNALDTLEVLASDPIPYFDGRAVGLIVTAFGWQAAGSTLMALRSIVHAMRGWPTPFGVTLNSLGGLFDEQGELKNSKDAGGLSILAEQVVGFSRLKQAA